MAYDLCRPSPGRVLDMGCGDGVFLDAVCSVLQTTLPDEYGDADSLARVVTGVDVVAERVCEARARLTRRFGEPAGGWDVRLQDALEMPTGERFDTVIGNPPWVRIHDIPKATRLRLRAEYFAARGMFDLAFVFIEEAIKRLLPGGRASLVVPSGLLVQPAAAPLRRVLDMTTAWTLEPLDKTSLSASAGVYPALLRLTKEAEVPTSVARERPEDRSPLCLTTGVVTGADKVFIVPEAPDQVEELYVRPALRARDIGSARASCPNAVIIFPYEDQNGRFRLKPLNGDSGLAAYLLGHKTALKARRKLAGSIRRKPNSWYRYIDPKVPVTNTRFAIPDIFCEPRFAIVEDPAVVILNTCFQLVPPIGAERHCLRLLNSPHFWEELGKGARRLSGGYKRTSATEIRQVIDRFL